MSSGLKHNKKRSTAIVYELLLRRVSENLIEGNRKGAASVVSILKRYFSPNTPIGFELEMIDAMRKNRGVSSNMASRIIAEIKIASKSLDKKLIEIKKSNLIKEINHTLGKDFFSSYKLQDYRALASMQVFIDSCTKKISLNEGLERAQIESAILSYMTNSNEQFVESYDPDRNNVSYSLALEKFKGKYGASLSDGQRILLEKYVSGLFSGDFKQFKNTALTDQKNIYRTILSSLSMKECKEDKILHERMTSSIAKLKELKVSTDESFVSEMMLFHDLAKEIKSNV